MPIYPSRQHRQKHCHRFYFHHHSKYTFFANYPKLQHFIRKSPENQISRLWSLFAAGTENVEFEYMMEFLWKNAYVVGFLLTKRLILRKTLTEVVS